MNQLSGWLREAQRENRARVILSDDGKEVLAIGAVAEIPEPEVFIFPAKAIRRHAKTFWRDLSRIFAQAMEKYPDVQSFEAEPFQLEHYFRKLGFDHAVPAVRSGVKGRTWRMAWV